MMIYLMSAIVGSLLLIAVNLTSQTSFASNSNMTSTNSTISTNTTSNTVPNSTSSNMSGISAAQTGIQEGMNSMKNKDSQSAIDHFNSAVDALGNTSSTVDVIRNLRQGIKALESGDQEGAMGSLQIADKELRGQ